MKNSFLIALITISFAGSAQNSPVKKIIGNWKGAIELQGFKLEIILKISLKDNLPVAKMDVPMQGGFDIPADSVGFRNDSLRVDFANLNARFKGIYSKDSAYIEGYFYQGGQSLELNLSPASENAGKTVRFQDPVQPYPYTEEEVVFENKKAGIKLAGTLTLPGKDKIYPVVVLISGSGAQNRNEELMGHRPFLVIADYLTRNGIAVLRFDDRGTGASTGKFKDATSGDFATDVNSAIDYLKTRKEIDKKHIGLIGHSEGGAIAPMIASKRKDVAFIVLLAGPGIKGSELLAMQNYELGKAGGMTKDELEKANEINRKCYDVACSNMHDTLKAAELKKLLGSDEEVEMSELNATIKELISPWMTYFLKYDPRPDLEKVKCPVLALNGEKDLQVPAKENLEGIESALKKGGNTKYTVKALPGLNHLFQTSTTGMPNEYGMIQETFSPEALKIINDWIKEAVK